MKKLAILGFAPSLQLAPFNDDSFELWGLNDLHTQFKATNVTRWFDIHPREQLEAMPVREGTGTYVDALRALPCPVYMQEQHKDIPNSKAYPKEQIITKFGGYFTNSISYMLAMAIAEGYKDIHIYGVDMAKGSEYNNQRPSCEYFIGLARGMGIHIHIPKESDLLKTAILYGYEGVKQTDVQKKYQARIAEFDNRLKKNEFQKMKLLMQHGYDDIIKENYFLLGAREDTLFYLQQWT